MAGEGPICAVCGRPIPPDARSSRHHLTPKLRGGARGDAVLPHQMCHAAIHARFSETEISRNLASPEALRADPDMARFIDWIRTKPDGFYAPTRRSGSKRGPHRGRGA